MKILIGYSTDVETLNAFLAKGHDAYTCDILPASHNRHLQCDIWEVANDSWDLGIFHPMCTYLTVSAAWAFKDPDYTKYPVIGYHQKIKNATLVGQKRREAREEAIENFKKLDALPYAHAIENPAPSFLSTMYRKPDQIIQPYNFGVSMSKSTGLWVKGLKKLNSTCYVPGRMVNYPKGSNKYVERWDNQTDSGQNKLSPSSNRWLERSKTPIGFAKAFAEQWG